MVESEKGNTAPNFKDRKGWLIVFGILQIILGGFCSIGTLFMILGFFIAASIDNNANPPMNLSAMIPGVLMYLVFAVWFIWMGVGSIKARRWARALVLTTSWIWLISGIITIIFMVLFMPDMYAQMGKSAQISQNVAFVMKIVMDTFMVVFLFVIPGILVLFYGSKSVKNTCEFRDTTVSWTDKCPLPILGLALLYGYGAFITLFNSFSGTPIPFFGLIISGSLGTVIFLASSALLGFLAWGFYNLKVKAFWTSVALCIFGGVSAVVTFATVRLLDFYSYMNFTPQTMEFMQTYEMPSKLNMALCTALWFAGIIGYIFYTKKYFTNLSIPKTATNEINQ